MRVEVLGTSKIVDAGTIEFTVPLPFETSASHPTKTSGDQPRVAERTSSEILPGIAIQLR